MPLEEYRRKRDFAKTPEPPPDPATAAQRPDRPIRRPAPSGDAAALRLPPRDRWRPRQLGRPQGPDPRSGDPAHGGPRRGPPDRVLRLRGRHPVQAVRRRRRDRLGLGHVGARGPDARRPQERPGRRAQVPPRRREGAGPVHDRPHQPPAGQRADDRVRGRPGRAVAAHPQEGRDVGQPAGTRRTTRRASRPAGRTTRSRRTATRSGSARRRPRPPRSTSPAPRRRRCPQHIEPMLATLATKAFSDPDWLFEIKWDGFRRPGGRRRRQGPDADPEPQRRRDLLPAALLEPPRWIEARAGHRRWRGRRARRRRAGPTSASSRRKLGDKAATGLVYQAFDLLYLDGRSLLDVPLEDRKRLLKSVLKDAPAGALRGPRRGRGDGLLRGRQADRASRGWSPSCGARATSPAGGRARG